MEIPSPIADTQGANQLAILSVREVSAAIKKTIESSFTQIRVRAELGRVTRPQSGHLYLDFKDEHAVLAGVMWRNQATQLGFAPETGLEVIATGRLTTYGPQSRYQLVVEHMEPAGQGALIALLEQRRKQLAAEGLFAAERKQALPLLPDVIGVITSPTGAVLRDILHRVQDRCPRRILLWPVRVQGTQCATEVAAAIAGFNALGGDSRSRLPRPDVLIVARGGGSLEDLWGFNDEAVVRAAAASRIPLISAVGHETDTTLLDYVADYRAPTPTAAAERAVPMRMELRTQLNQFGQRQYQAVYRLLSHNATRLESARRALRRPADVLHLREQQYDALARRLTRALHGQWLQAQTTYARFAGALQIQLLRQRLDSYAAQLRVSWARHGQSMRAHIKAAHARLAQAETALGLLSHEAVLARGFALVFAGARLVRKTADAPPATNLRIQLAKGASVRAQVPVAKKAPRRAARQKKSRRAATADLFGDTP